MQRGPDYSLAPAVSAETLARAIIARQPRVSTIRLLKLAFLAETRYAERSGARLSDADWFSWKHGPFSKRIVNSVQSQPAAVIRHEQKEVFGKTANYDMPGPDCAPILPPAISTLLDDLLSVYGGEDTLPIVNAVYCTSPFLRTPSGRKIDLDGWARTSIKIRESSEVHGKIRAALQSESVLFSCTADLLDSLNEARISDRPR
jgi:hypothetical protein